MPLATQYPIGTGNQYIRPFAETAGISPGGFYSYGGKELSLSGVFFKETNIFSHSAELKTTKKPRNHGEDFISLFWRGRDFSVSVDVANIGGNGQELEDLKRSLYAQKQADFVIKLCENKLRKILCSFVGLTDVYKFVESRFLRNITLNFKALDGCLYDLEKTTKIFPNITSQGDFGMLSHQGTFLDVPATFIIQFNSAVGVSSFTFSDGERNLVFSGAVSSGDIFEINGNDVIIKKNAIEFLGWEGRIPTLTAFQKRLSLVSNGTHNVSITTIYNNGF